MSFNRAQKWKDHKIGALIILTLPIFISIFYFKNSTTRFRWNWLFNGQRDDSKNIFFFIWYQGRDFSTIWLFSRPINVCGSVWWKRNLQVKYKTRGCVFRSIFGLYGCIWIWWLISCLIFIQMSRSEYIFNQDRNSC